MPLKNRPFLRADSAFYFILYIKSHILYHFYRFFIVKSEFLTIKRSIYRVWGDKNEILIGKIGIYAPNPFGEFIVSLNLRNFYM
jgi:hypothetical protein